MVVLIFGQAIQRADRDTSLSVRSVHSIVLLAEYCGDFCKSTHLFNQPRTSIKLSAYITRLGMSSRASPSSTLRMGD